MTHPRPNLAVAAAAIALALLGGACSSDDGATVRDLGADGAETGSGSASSSASASASAVASGDVAATATEDGGYDYVSNVDGHRLVTQDVCDIKTILESDPIDFEAAEAVYREGANSESSDGSMRTLAGFATEAGLDDWMSEALDGTGRFADASDAVRSQAVEKGIQNQILVAWTLDELESAADKAADGDLDPDTGAPHNWDEAWAFYHGAQPACAPYATADSRAANFGTLGEGDTARANEAIRAAMIEGRDALLDADTSGVDTPIAEIERNLAITYSQAIIRYATLTEADRAAGDTETADEHRIEGLAFSLVLEDLLTEAGADMAAIADVYSLDAEAGSNGGGDEVTAALEPAWSTLGISTADIGELE